MTDITVGNLLELCKTCSHVTEGGMGVKLIISRHF